MALISLIKNKKTVLKITAVISTLAIIGGAFYVGRRTAPPVITQVTQRVEVAVDETTLTKMKTEIIAEMAQTIDTKLKVSVVSASSSKKKKTSTDNIVVKITELDPKTGNPIKITEKTTESTSTKIDTTSTDTTTDTTADITKAETTTANVVVDDTATTHTAIAETSTVDTVEKPANIPNPSPLGIGISMKAKPMLTYDIVKISRYSLAGTLEIDTKKPTISGAGAAVLFDINKRQDWYAGVYGTHKFKEKETEVGVMLGRRF